MTKERSEILSIRLSKKDRIALEGVAKYNSQTPSEFARNVLVDRVNHAEEDRQFEISNQQLLKVLTSIGNSLNEKVCDLRKDALDGLQKVEHDTNELAEKYNSVDKAIRQLSNNIVLITKAIIITSPKYKKELQEIFKNEKVWEGIDG